MSRRQQELIAQVRVVMQSLTVPAPHVLALVEDVEHLDVTQVQLPIVEFSPFASLSVPQVTSRDNATTPRQRTSTLTVPYVQSPQRQETTPASSDTEDRPTPVFSLRARATDRANIVALGRSHPSLRSQSATDGSPQTPRHHQAIAGAADALGSEMHRAEFSSGETQETPALAEQSSGRVSSNAISWLEFATLALNGIADADSSRHSASSNHGENQDEASIQRPQTVHDVNRETANRNGAVIGGVPLSPLGQRDDQTDELTSSVISHTRIVSQNPPIVRMGSVSIPDDRGGDSQSSQLIAPSGQLGHLSLDAEEIASLVNDILVEQARRNGVDLS